VPMSGDNFPRRYSVVAETRRKWSDAEKHSIVAEAERPGANISAVARRHGIKPNLLFRWRRLAREARALSCPDFRACDPGSAVSDSAGSVVGAKLAPAGGFAGCGSRKA
jgi:transposase-like protein